MVVLRGVVAVVVVVMVVILTVVVVVVGDADNDGGGGWVGGGSGGWVVVMMVVVVVLLVLLVVAAVLTTRLSFDQNVSSPRSSISLRRHPNNNPCRCLSITSNLFSLFLCRVVDARWAEMGRRRKWRTFVNNAQTAAQLLAAWGAFRVSAAKILLY